MYKIEITEDQWLLISEVMLNELSYLEDIKNRYQAEAKTNQKQAREFVNSMRNRVYEYQKKIDDLNELYNKMAEVIHSE